MKRLATLALFFAVLALGQREGVATAANADSYCPPGSLFCPTPASGAPAAADTGFGLGSYGNPSSGGESYFQSGLHEGEQLLMVAPGGDYANVPAPGTVPMAAAPFAAPVPQPVMDASSYGSGYSAPSDGLLGFIPPPPGARPNAVPVNYAPDTAPLPVASSVPAYQAVQAAQPMQSQPEMGMGWGGQQSFASQPAQNYEYTPNYAPAMAAAPGPLTADAFAAPAMPPAREPQMGFAARQPEPAAVERDPYGVVTKSDFSSRPSEVINPYQKGPAKKRRADMLSEVATESQQKKALGKVDLKPRPENRLPWWKGGFWRNKDDDDAGEKKSRADRKEEKRQAKLAAKEAKLAARKAEDEGRESN